MLKVGDVPLNSFGSGVSVGVLVGSDVGVFVTGSVIPGVGVSVGATVVVMVEVDVGVRKGTCVSEVPQALVDRIKNNPEKKIRRGIIGLKSEKRINFTIKP
jgi:hypothetical protein